ncbi:hypothetical protein HY214_01915 [Candidatus Roizmanbacteria bacterium]|nr:hypothetical protein [Candidatus Roizmanbacteria bacterium]
MAEEKLTPNEEALSQEIAAALTSGAVVLLACATCPQVIYAAKEVSPVTQAGLRLAVRIHNPRHKLIEVNGGLSN